jgi:threonine/homoserine/homoserine lactone efflux protein
MAFLPQFIDINYSPIPQALMMASVHFMIAMVWQGLLVLMVSKARIWLQRPAVSTTMDGATGVLLMGFGLKLGTS